MQDQSAAVELLGKAIAELTMVYENLAKSSFLQLAEVNKGKQEPEGPSAGLTHTDAPEMGGYKKSQAGTGAFFIYEKKNIESTTLTLGPFLMHFISRHGYDPYPIITSSM